MPTLTKLNTGIGVIYGLKNVPEDSLLGCEMDV